ncbi:MAG: DUF6128 domain-containing protein [Clostridiales bacterium]|nr:DUF6128 domain-containing protein [Clostridiales bacterium]
MSFCRRFVTYLFQYENQTKGRNCGFAKVDARQGRCRMEIQMKGCDDGNYAVYLLRQSEQELVGMPIGEIRVGNGAGKTVLLFPTEEIGGSRSGLEDMQGIYLTAGKNSFAASQWEDGELAWESFQIYKGRDMPEVSADGMEGEAADARAEDVSAETYAEKESAEDVPEPQVAVAVTEKDGAESMRTDTSNNRKEKGNFIEAESDAEPEMQATQTAAAIDISPYMTAWEKRWQRFCVLHPLIFPFDEEKKIYAVKIDLRDIRSLPKPYWQLANNSFLLHGYFNYRYILLGCEDGEKKKWFVAVPGVFQNQEQLLAGLFGFGEFRTKHLTRQKTGEFGFWYRYLEM